MFTPKMVFMTSLIELLVAEDVIILMLNLSKDIARHLHCQNPSGKKTLDPKPNPNPNRVFFRVFFSLTSAKMCSM